MLPKKTNMSAKMKKSAQRAFDSPTFTNTSSSKAYKSWTAKSKWKTK